MNKAALRRRAGRVFSLLVREYPDARCMLNHRDAYQLLTATILAAQCTDARVNEVTPALFDRFSTPAALAKVKPETLEQLIRPTGFFRQKTKSLLSCAKDIVERFEGRVPGTMEELTSLRGVGRKTANVVLGECFARPGIVVDTHVKRVTNRIGLTTENLSDKPDKIESELDKLIDGKDRTLFSHVMTFHGRAVCAARKPRCPECVIRKLCDTGAVGL